MTISGAKNATLGILAASIVTDEDVLIDNPSGCKGTLVCNAGSLSKRSVQE